jgi:hypothetical protein
MNATATAELKHEIAHHVSAIKADADARKMFKRFRKFLKSTHDHERNTTVTTTTAKTATAPFIVNTDTVEEANVKAIHKLNAATSRSSSDYADMQKRIALRDQLEIAKSTGKSPKVRMAQPEGKGGGSDDDEPLSKKIADYLKAKGWGVDKFDIAATAVLSQVLQQHCLRGQGYDDNSNPESGIHPIPQA